LIFILWAGCLKRLPKGCVMAEDLQYLKEVIINRTWGKMYSPFARALSDSRRGND